ncbi:MAG: BBP7 family outer membrane beta-barrel protein, partial [Planctomycetes bacterium]|nr:BBP7 family outer membrane beta-barrel protein [Planctomycetota bacterium]
MSRTSDSRKSFESTGPLSEPAASSWISDEALSEPGDDQGVVFASDLPHGVSLASTISHLPHSASLAEPVGFAVVGDIAPVQPTAWANNQATSRDQTRSRGVLNDPFELPLLWGGGERLYARGEYLRWKIQGNHVPALVTSSPTGTAQNQAGVLGFSTTTILFGDSNLHAEDRAGGRLTVGYWLSSDDVFGIEATYYQVESSSASFSTSSTGDPILARPFFNVDPNVGPGQDSSILAMAGWVGTLPQFGATSVDLQGDVSVFAQNELRSGAIA